MEGVFLKKKDVLELVVEKIDFPNKGICLYEDKKIIVKNALPKQKILGQINKKKNGQFEARLMEVVEKSPLETLEGCGHNDICGGCLYQTISFESELEIKKNQVFDILNNAYIKDFQFEGIELPHTGLNYRNKCEFSFGDNEKGGVLSLGMRKKQSYYEVVDLKSCNIVDNDYLVVVQAVVQFFRKLEVPFYHKNKKEGVLRHLVVRKGYYTGEILINLITTSSFKFSQNDFANMLKNLEVCGIIKSVLHTINDGVADVVKSDETILLFGEHFYHDKIFDLTFKISAFSFFQTNTKGAELIYNTVKEFVGNKKDKIIFDLYCGTGTISLVLNDVAKEIYGIELIEQAIESAKENAINNNVSNCHFIAGDVLQKIDDIKVSPDIIVLDPPREGIHPKAINKIIDFNAPEIIYISCKASSLSKDLNVLIENGYNVDKLKCVNQFNRTTHVECIVLLTKNEF